MGEQAKQASGLSAVELVAELCRRLDGQIVLGRESCRPAIEAYRMAAKLWRHPAVVALDAGRRVRIPSEAR